MRRWQQRSREASHALFQHRVVQIGEAGFDGVVEPTKPLVRLRDSPIEFGEMFATALGPLLPLVKEIGEYGVTEQQWRILRALVTTPSLEVTDLARATFLLGPSLSRILRDLEHRQLIRRRVDPEDAQRAHISISPMGLALVETDRFPVPAIDIGEIDPRF